MLREDVVDRRRFETFGFHLVKYFVNDAGLAASMQANPYIMVDVCTKKEGDSIVLVVTIGHRSLPGVHVMKFDPLSDQATCGWNLTRGSAPTGRQAFIEDVIFFIEDAALKANVATRS
jgi:hypothetical protein